MLRLGAMRLAISYMHGSYLVEIYDFMWSPLFLRHNQQLGPDDGAVLKGSKNYAAETSCSD